MKKILFVVHEANYTGAPLIALNLITWLNIHSDYHISTLLLKDGQLREKFKKNSNELLLLPSRILFKNNILNKIFLKFFYKKTLTFFYKKISKSNYDLIFSNSIATNYIIEDLKKFTKSKVIANVLELDFTFKNFNINQNSAILKNSSTILAMNKSVANYLVDNYKISLSKIKILNSFTEFSLIKSDKNHLKQKLNLPKNSFIIGASGTVEWRKGSELFIQLALLMKKKLDINNIFFVWVGGFVNENDKLRIEYDIKKAELENNIFYLGQVTNVNDFYSDFDLFTLLSREEALGLVCIENMALGNPVICFEKCGGMEEVADIGAAIKVPYLDLPAMVDKIIELKTDYKRYKSISKKSIEYIKKEYNKDKIGKKYLDLFNHLVK